MKDSARFSIVAVVLIAAILFGFARLNQFRFEEHKQTDNNLDDIEKLDTTLNETVVKARFGLVADYDIFNEQIAGMKALTSAAAHLPSFVPMARQTAYQQELQRFNGILAEKEDLIEKFKSDNAVLNNSLQYLPTANSEILARMEGTPDSHTLEDLMNLIVQRVFIHCLRDGDDEVAPIHDTLGKIDDWRVQHPNHAEAGALTQIMAHVNSIITRKSRVEALTQRIVSLPTYPSAEKLSQLYDVELAHALSRGSNLQMILEGLCALLIAAVAYTIYALDRAKRDLEVRVIERTSELRETNRRFEVVTAATTNVIWDWDLAAGTVWWNENFQSVFGYSAEETGTGTESWTGRIHPDDVKEALDSLHAAVQSGKVWSCEYRFRRRDGSYAFVFDRGHVVQDDQGRPVRMIGAIQDFTQRRQAEEELRESEHRYRDLVASLPAALYTCDAQGRITLFNKAAATLWGREPKLGEDLWCGALKIFEVDGRPVSREESSIAKAIREGEVERSRELIIERPDGSRSYVLPHPMLLRDSAGAILGAVNMIVDLTERHQAEEQMERLHRQLLDTSRQAGMAEVATGVLHNVGNVLNSVNVSATLVADCVRKSRASNLGRVVALMDLHAQDLGVFITEDNQGKNLPAYLRQLNEYLGQEQQSMAAEVDALRKNIEHINDIVAMQQNYARVSGVREVMKITELVEDSLHINESALNRHQVEVVRDYEETPQICVEKHKALQILVNLIRNAKYACDEGRDREKRLTVRVSNGEGSIKVSIIDNGVGIPAENLTRIFNHGFTTRKDGHGFGLHSGALAAKELGGALSVYSAGPGAGANFTLELPLTTPGGAPHSMVA